MFPIRDHNPSRRTPYVAYGLIAVNVLIYVSYGFRSEAEVWAVFTDWALTPAEVMAGEALHTFLSAMFLHGGLMHLAGNMLFLWIFGDNLEDYLGHAGMLLFYLVCGIAASLAQIAVDPASQIPNVGASGAIAGLMGGYMLLFPKARVDVLFIIVVIVRVVPLPAMAVLGGWLAIQLFSGYGAAAATSQQGGVAYWAHIGGFLAGIGGIGLIWAARGRPPRWPDPPHPPAPPTLRNPWAR